MENRLDPVSARSLQKVIMAQIIVADDAEERGEPMEIDDEEDVLLELCKFASEHHFARVRPRVAFDEPAVLEPWDQYETHVFREYTRFLPEDFLNMCTLLEIPVDGGGDFVSQNRCVCDPRLAVFILLRRWALPDRWIDLEHQLRLRKSWLHDIYRSILSVLVSQYGTLATRVDIFRLQPILSTFADAVEETGGLVPNVVAFIDGKPWASCRPAGVTSKGPRDDLQRAFYSGYYKHHGLKIQNVMFVDGIRLVHVSTIRDHDQSLLEKSEMEAQFNCLFIDGDLTRPAVCYGDPAYSETDHIKRKHKGAGRSKEQRRLDASMIPARAVVEDGFLKHAAIFPLMDYRKKNKVMVSPLRDQLIAQTVFLNLHTCYYGSQVNGTFEIYPPSPMEYLSNAKLDFIP